MTGSQCYKCLWFISDMNCQAYPEGIPLKFFLNKEKHSKKEKYQISDFIYEDKNKE